MQSLNKITKLSTRATERTLDNIRSKLVNSNWDEEVFFIANELSLPLTPCLLEPDLKIINTYSPQSDLTLENIISSLGTEWKDWEKNVEACLLKLNLGITAQSVEDVYLQVSDVTEMIGRKPVSKEEFHSTKEQLFRQQYTEMESTYETKLDLAANKTKEIIQLLDTKNHENHLLIEKLEESYNQVVKLQEDNAYLEDNFDMSKHVKIELYEKITQQLEEAEASHEDVIHFYLDKISNLEKSNASENILNEKVNQSLFQAQSKIKQLTLQLKTSEHSKELKLELIQAKSHIIDLLKGTISLKKKNNLLVKIKSQQGKNLQIIRSHQIKPEKTKINSWEIFGRVVFGMIVAFGAIMSFVLGLSLS